MTVWHRAMTLAWRLHALHEAVDRVRIYGPKTVDEADLAQRLDLLEQGVQAAERSGVLLIDLPEERTVHQAVMHLLEEFPTGIALKEVNRLLGPKYGAPAVAMVLLPLIVSGRAHNNHGQVRLVAHNELEDTP